MSTSTDTTVTEWETFEGMTYGRTERGVMVVEVTPMYDTFVSEPGSPVARRVRRRMWTARMRNGEIVSGEAADLRIAKRAALAALAADTTMDPDAAESARRAEIVDALAQDGEPTPDGRIRRARAYRGDHCTHDSDQICGDCGLETWTVDAPDARDAMGEPLPACGECGRHNLGTMANPNVPDLCLDCAPEILDDGADFRECCGTPADPALAMGHADHCTAAAQRAEEDRARYADTNAGADDDAQRERERLDALILPMLDARAGHTVATLVTAFTGMVPGNVGEVKIGPALADTVTVRRYDYGFQAEHQGSHDLQTVAPESVGEIAEWVVMLRDEIAGGAR
jgi:hypothetical protein